MQLDLVVGSTKSQRLASAVALPATEEGVDSGGVGASPAGERRLSCQAWSAKRAASSGLQEWVDWALLRAAAVALGTTGSTGCWGTEWLLPWRLLLLLLLLVAETAVVAFEQGEVGGVITIPATETSFTNMINGHHLSVDSVTGWIISLKLKRLFSLVSNRSIQSISDE